MPKRKKKVKKGEKGKGVNLPLPRKEKKKKPIVQRAEGGGQTARLLRKMAELPSPPSPGPKSHIFRWPSGPPTPLSPRAQKELGRDAQGRKKPQKKKRSRGVYD